MNNPARIAPLLRAILFLLFVTWLVLFVVNPVLMAPDSYGYFADSKGLFDPGFVTMRPVLYPFFIRIVNGLHIKMSIAAYLVNCVSLLCLVKAAVGKRPLLSPRNTVVLIFFFMLTGFWSYCGTYLTESILPAVTIWIFILFVRILLPARKQSIPVTILYSALVCILATTLKPWIMIMVLLAGALLLLSGFVFRSFGSRIRPAFILLAVSFLAFIACLGYNRSKSQEKANMVVLMISSGNENTLRERLAGDKSLSKEDAEFIPALLSEIELINRKYNRNPWVACDANELKVLNFHDKGNGPVIDRAFRTMYFQRGKDLFGLALLSFERYVSQLRFDTSCLEIAYGPELPVLRNSTAVIIILSLALLVAVYQMTRPLGAGRAGLAPIKAFLKKYRQSAIFSGAIVAAGILFSLFLCLAGADELQRNVLPAALFQIVALAWLVMKPVTASKN